jgi:DNA recombination protein RmuC
MNILGQMDGMSLLVGLFIGLAVAAVAAAIYVRSRLSSVTEDAKEKDDLKQQLNDKIAELGRLQERAERIAQLEQEKREMQQRFDQEEDETRDRYEAEERELRDKIEQLDQKNADLEATRRELEKTVEEREKNLKEQKELFDEARQKLEETFAALSRQALEGNTKSFLELAEERLGKHHEQQKSEFDKSQQKFGEYIKPIQEKLEEYDENLDKLRREQSNYLHNLTENLKLQQTTTQKLESMLKGPTSRGKVGELYMKTLLDRAGLIEGQHYELQTTHDSETGSKKPDCLLHLPGGKRLVIDAKTPLNAYEDSLSVDEDDARNVKLDLHVKNVQDEIKRLAARDYREAVGDCEFVVMYLPIEASLSAALLRDPNITSFGWEKGVVLTTPTLLFVLLQLVALDWRQQDLAENAQEISEAGKEMYDRVCTFAGHFERVGKGLNTAVTAYDQAVGSIETRLLSQARKLKDLGAASNKDLPEPEQLGRTTRQLQNEELLSLDFEEPKED